MTTANIKMYRLNELGDCFLLRFTNGDHSSHVLIDCGSFRNGKKSIDRLTEIVEDIQKQTKNNIDVVVATHQHNDHVSGFYHCESLFKKIKVGKVWLSWMDNPKEKLAVQIGKEYNNLLLSLRKINLKINALKPLGYKLDDTINKVESLLTFYGVSTKEDKKIKNDKFPPDVPSQGYKVLKQLAGNPKYLSPGETFDLPGLPNGVVKVYVLGPPKKEEYLKDITPNKNETYDPELALVNVQADKMINALNRLTSGSNEVVDEDFYPFNEPDSNSKNLDMIYYRYMNKEKWRQIDNDWLKQAERLALWLDNFTNNSSLVLAFELAQMNKVLLFAADAQTGNWNSWKTIKWKGKEDSFDWKSLLKNTVLYKVGHHCSHNATLVEGLELMENDDLVAMITVNKNDGNITKENGWKMPAKNLFEHLREKTKNRILRMDDGIVDKSKDATKKSWKKLGAAPKERPLYIEFEIQDGVD